MGMIKTIVSILKSDKSCSDKWELSGFTLFRSCYQSNNKLLTRYPVRAAFVGSAHEYRYNSINPESPLKVIY
jgi:hypothetical protein